MSFEEFTQAVLEELRARDTGMEFMISEYTKRNNVTIKALAMSREGDTVSVRIYMKAFEEIYRRMCSDEKRPPEQYIKEMADIILEIDQENEKDRDEIRNIDMFDFDQIRSGIYLMLVNEEMNREKLKGHPHRKFLDLAVIYIVRLKKDNDSNMTYQITNEQMKIWGCTEEELYQLAFYNTPRLLPPVVIGIEDIIQRMLLEDNRFPSDFKEVFEKQFMEGSQEDEHNEMVCIGCGDQNHGAGVLLYKDVLDRAADRLGADEIVILPSSVHEVLAVRKESSPEFMEWMKGIVYQVNHTELLPEDVLSESVYIYNRKEKHLEIAE